MNLQDILQRTHPPIPWQEGDNIPWNEPGFSERMLAEHLTQAHDRASRRSHIIDQQVAWIHQALLHEQPTRILDLGCGPGLYSNRLAAFGHSCHGIDYSPASIAYAQNTAKEENLTVTYLHQDMRAAPFGSGYGLAMLLFGEINVFSKKDAVHILTKAFDALAPGGLLILEAHTDDSMIPDPSGTNRWFTSEGGLFSPRPHLALIEQTWVKELAITTTRYYIIDAATTSVTRYAQSMQAYSTDQYEQLLADIGYGAIEFFRGLAHDRLTPAPEFQAITAAKPS